MGLKRIPEDLPLSLWWESLMQDSKTRIYMLFSVSGVYRFKAQKRMQGIFLSLLSTNNDHTIAMCYALVSRLYVYYLL